MMFSPCTRALLTVLVGGQVALAAPACSVQTTAHLDTYQVSSGAHGLISVQVRCPDTGRYVLRVEGDGAPLRGPTATLNLTTLTGQSLPATVEVQGIPLGTAFSGTQHFDLALWAAPGQWQLGGAYRALISVSAERLDATELP